MECENTSFFNVIVKNVKFNNIQKFMTSWLSQQHKDFRIVFIYEGIDDFDCFNTDETKAIAYAKKFAESIGHGDMVVAVKYGKDIPLAQFNVVCDDTSVLPADKNEELGMKFEVSENIKEDKVEKLEDKAEQNVETENTIENKQKLVEKDDAAKMMLQQKPIDTKVSQKKEVEKVEVIKSVEKVFFKIIVPNYNNMAYIKKCLDSILEQTFQDFKIIVVDDLSTDGSDNFCEMYARKHQDKIIFKRLDKKGYAGAARNVGLDYPLDCKYILFVDSDDWLYNNMILMKMKQSIAKNRFPLLIRMPMFHYYGQNSKLNRFDRHIPPDKKTIFLNGPGPGRFCISEKLKNLRFIENRAKRNDVIWVLHCLDIVKPTEILSLDYCCQTYNRASTTSCQNNIDVQLSQRCIEDGTTNHINDVKKQKFKTKTCNDLAKLEINIVSNIYKPKITAKELLKNSYVISINNDQLNSFYQIFQNFGIIQLPKLFYGCVDKKYTVIQRIKQSHINLVEFAKKNNMPYVCIFEDDAYPQKSISYQLERYLRAIPNDALMVVLGWISGQYQQLIKPFSKITQFTISGAHSYILFKNGYDRWLKLMKENHPFTYPPDNYIFKDMQKAYIVNYPLFIQYNKTHSAHNHVNFIFNGENKTPPPKFEMMKK